MGIVAKLNEMRIPTFADTQPRGFKKQRPYGEWSRASVHRILTNPTYVGLWQFGKTGKVDKRRVKNPDGHRITIEVPAIVDKQL
jgi:hypothetical protein